MFEDVVEVKPRRCKGCEQLAYRLFFLIAFICREFSLFDETLAVTLAGTLFDLFGIVTLSRKDSLKVETAEIPKRNACSAVADAH